MSEQHFNDTATLGFSRRAVVAGIASVGAMSAAAPARAEITKADFRDMPPYGNGTLPDGVRSRFVPNVNGLTVNILEAGFETPGRPLVLMLHGFPNLAYSWRKVIPALAAAGYYAVAPDCRGFGRTTGWDNSWDADLSLSCSQSAARPDCARLCTRLPQHSDDGGTRPGLAHGRFGRIDLA